MQPLRAWWTSGTLPPRVRRRVDQLRTLLLSPPGQLGILGASLALIAYSLYLRIAPQASAPCDVDFYAFYHSALALRRGTSPYAALAAWIDGHASNPTADPFSATACLSGVLEFAYTPFFGYVLTPFTALPYGTALRLWDGCEVLFLGGAIYAFLRAAGVTPRPAQLALLTGAVMFAGPFRFALYYAQADLLFVLLICCALWARCSGRAVLAGVLLALACACEPALLAAVPVLVWKREWRFAAVSVLVALALIFVPFLWLGRAALAQLVVIWRFYATQHAAVNPFNDAPLGILMRLFAPTGLMRPLVDAPSVVWPLWLLLSLAILLGAARLIARQPLGNDGRSLLEVGLAAAALLLISPYAENNHFTLLLLPFLAVFVCLSRGDWREPAARMLLASFAGALLLAYTFSDPLQRALLARLESGSAVRVVYLLLEAVYLYPLLAIGAVVIYAQRVTSRVAAAGGDLGRHETIADPAHESPRLTAG